MKVPGERVLGSFSLDDVKQTMTVHFPATLEVSSSVFYLLEKATSKLLSGAM